MSRSTLPTALACTFFLVACSDTPGGGSGGDCRQNSDCSAGSICSSGSCVRLCATQEECPDGQVCNGTTCIDAADSIAPSIDTIAGNDPSDSSSIVDGMVVTGTNLETAAFELRPATGSAIGLTVRSQTEATAELVFPEDILSGDYALVATNGAGDDQAPVTLLLPELSGTEIINRINDGGTTGTVLAARLPVGTTTGTVAAGDHTHVSDATLREDVLSYIESGSLSLAGGLQVGNVTATCDGSLAGTMRYASGALEVCIGSAWVAIVQARDGSSAAHAARDCKTLLADYPSTSDGVYWLDPEGQGNAFQTYCDMTTNGGGWTMVANIASNDGNSVGYANEDFWTKERAYGTLGNRFSNDYKSAAAWRVAGDALLIESTQSGAAGSILGWRRWPLSGAPSTFDSLFAPTGEPYAWGSLERQKCATGNADAVDIGTTNTSDAIIRQGTCLRADFITVPGSAWPDMSRLTTTTGTADDTMGGFGTFINGYASWNPSAPFMGLDSAGCSGASCNYSTLCRAGNDCAGDYCSGTYNAAMCGTVWNSRFFVR
jgi:hypothetical protein